MIRKRGKSGYKEQTLSVTEIIPGRDRDAPSVHAIETTTKSSYPQAITTSFAQKLRAVALFIVAGVTSPCCSPVVVLFLLTILAGTPLAAWITDNLVWIYGSLTAISILSLVQGLRGLRPKSLAGLTIRGSRHQVSGNQYFQMDG